MNRKPLKASTKVRIIVEGVQVFARFDGLSIREQGQAQEAHLGTGAVGIVYHVGNDGANVQIDWSL